MAEQLYRMIRDPQDGEPVQLLAVYATRWRPEWGEPPYAFIEAEPEPDALTCATCVHWILNGLFPEGTRGFCQANGWTGRKSSWFCADHEPRPATGQAVTP